MYGGQLPRGSAYVELQRCAVILIANFIELEGQRFHSVFRLLEQQSGRPFTDHLEIHVLELPKLPLGLDQNDEPTLLLWGRFLAATQDQDLEQLATEHPMLKQAKEALDRLSADPDARLRAEQRELALLSYDLGIATARREGRLEGKAEGRLEGKAEVLQRQLMLKFGELPDDIITRVVGATERDLARWSERVLSASSLDDVFS
jgi:predicted transposase/invertase (TIGR01784 family)